MGSDMQATVDSVVEINDPGNIGKIEVPPEFSGKWGDFGKDMAAIAAEQPQPAKAGELTELVVETPAPPTTPEPTQPKAAEVQPEAAATPEIKAQSVPDKFKTPDGQLDQERLLKSYSDAEKELKRLQNAQRTPAQDQLAPAQPATPQVQQVPQTFEAQLEQDVKARGIGPVLAQLFYAARESALQGSMQEIQGLREVHENQIRGEELKAIAARDPWVFTREGLQTLTDIRKTRPWVNGSPEPWKEAYRSFLADRAMGSNGNGQQVQTPTPKAPTAPPGSVGAANRTVEPVLHLDSQEAILAHVATLPPDKEAEFWKKAGFKWKEIPRKA